MRALAHTQGRRLGRIFIDRGYSGATLKRPAIQGLLESIGASEIEALYVGKLDRICRSLADLLLIVHLCEKRGVALISAAESIDTGSPTGHMMISMLGAFSQFERERIAERIRDVAFDKRQQKKVYCGSVPFGYRREASILVEEQGEQATLSRMRDTGRSEFAGDRRLADCEWLKDSRVRRSSSETPGRG